MICEDCAAGAVAYRKGLRDEAVTLHLECCPGPDWCDCQHMEAARAGG